MRWRDIEGKWVGFTAFVVAVFSSAAYSLDWSVTETALTLFLVAMAVGGAVEVDRAP